MFSKNNNTYLFPQVSSSSNSLHHTRPSLVDLNGVEIFLHHHPEIFSGNYNLTGSNNVPVSVPDHHRHHHHHHHEALLVQNDDTPNTGDVSANVNVFQKKQTAKKDRHSKIFTSQGPRDRRVRLSIGIARKFFDLQEMLGFDKPSKTLDWLLTKSKAAIKDLVQTTKEKGDKSTSSSLPSECELVSSEYGEDSKGKAGNKSIKGSGSINLVKESRAKARARARERTREKMQMKNGGENGVSSSELNRFNIPFQYKNNNNNQLGVFQLSAGSSSSGSRPNQAMFHCPLTNEAAAHHHQDLIQESVVIKRKTKNPSSFFGFQQNVIVSRDLSSNYGIPFAGAAAENWDICSFTSQSNLCAILDQHKLMNSSSNM